MKEFSESNPVKGYIIMEYLENVKGVQVFENLSTKDVRQVSLWRISNYSGGKIYTDIYLWSVFRS